MCEWHTTWCSTKVAAGRGTRWLSMDWRQLCTTSPSSMHHFDEANFARRHLGKLIDKTTYKDKIYLTINSYIFMLTHLQFHRITVCPINFNRNTRTYRNVVKPHVLRNIFHRISGIHVPGVCSGTMFAAPGCDKLCLHIAEHDVYGKKKQQYLFYCC